jgi:hypothetical protein
MYLDVAKTNIKIQLTRDDKQQTSYEMTAIIEYICCIGHPEAQNISWDSDLFPMHLVHTS